MAALVDMANLTDRQLLEKIRVKMSMIDKLSEQMDRGIFVYYHYSLL